MILVKYSVIVSKSFFIFLVAFEELFWCEERLLLLICQACSFFDNKHSVEAAKDGYACENEEYATCS